MADWSEALGQLAGELLESGGVQVWVKTNLGPPLRVAGGAGGGLADALGLKAAVLVTDRQGRKLASYGTPPPTEPMRVALLIAVAGVLGFLLLRGGLKR